MRLLYSKLNSKMANKLSYVVRNLESINQIFKLILLWHCRINLDMKLIFTCSEKNSCWIQSASIIVDIFFLLPQTNHDGRFCQTKKTLAIRIIWFGISRLPLLCYRLWSSNSLKVFSGCSFLLFMFIMFIANEFLYES